MPFAQRILTTFMRMRAMTKTKYVLYVDTEGLPKLQAEQWMHEQSKIVKEFLGDEIALLVLPVKGGNRSTELVKLQ